MENTLVTKHNGIDTFQPLADLIDAITKVVPDITVKTDDSGIHTYGVDKNIYPDGIAYRHKVYHNTDLNNHIGIVAIERWNSKTPKFNIQNINIDDGRDTYGLDGQFKSSIHAKNIVRIAKKVFKPFTFDQISKRTCQNFYRRIEGIRNEANWATRNNTCNDYRIFTDDLRHLHAMGYEPQSIAVKKIMDYVVEHKEKMDKYLDYSPKHYFVLIKENQVQYCLNDDNGRFPNPTTVSSKDELPDEIKGKLFVLDITEGKDFVEEVGLKENDGAYWIIA